VPWWDPLCHGGIPCAKVGHPPTPPPPVLHWGPLCYGGTPCACRDVATHGSTRAARQRSVTKILQNTLFSTISVLVGCCRASGPPAPQGAVRGRRWYRGCSLGWGGSGRRVGTVPTAPRAVRGPQGGHGGRNPRHASRAAPSSPARSLPVGGGCQHLGVGGPRRWAAPPPELTCSAWRRARSWHRTVRISSKSCLQPAPTAQPGPDRWPGAAGDPPTTPSPIPTHRCWARIRSTRMCRDRTSAFRCVAVGWLSLAVLTGTAWKPSALGSASSPDAGTGHGHGPGTRHPPGWAALPRSASAGAVGWGALGLGTAER